MCTSWLFCLKCVLCKSVGKRRIFLISCLFLQLQPQRSIMLYASKLISYNRDNFLFSRTYNEIRKKNHTNLVNSLRRLLNWSQTNLKAYFLFVPHYNFPLLVCQGWRGGSFSAEGIWHFPSLDKRYKYWQTESHIQIYIQVRYLFFSWRKQTNLLKIHQIP